MRQLIQPEVLLPIFNSSINLTIYQFLYEHIHPFIYKSNQPPPHTFIRSPTTEAISPSQPSAHWLTIRTHVHFMFDNNPLFYTYSPALGKKRFMRLQCELCANRCVYVFHSFIFWSAWQIFVQLDMNNRLLLRRCRLLSYTVMMEAVRLSRM